MMQRTLKPLLIVLTLALTAPLAGAGDVEGFHSTWSKATEVADKETKPVYIHFTTTWCGWCRKIENDTYDSELGKKVLEDFVPVSLDCTVPRGQQPSGETRTNIELMQKYGGSGYPFLVMTTPDGTMLHSFSGYRDPEGFQAEAKAALDAWKSYKDFLEYAAEADKSSCKYNKKALDFYAAVENYEKAAEAARHVLSKCKEKTEAQKALGHLVLFNQGLSQDKDQQAKEHMQKLRTLDPKNQKGYVEQAVWAKVNHIAAKLRSIDDEAKAKQALARVVETLEILTAEDMQLEDPVRMLFVLGNLYNTLEESDKAVDAWNEALKHNPPARLAQEIQRRIDQTGATE
jgi:thioredoxin-related protein